MAFNHPHLQQRQSPQTPFRDIYENMESQIPRPATFFAGNNLPDQSHHPPYVPPFHVVGLAPPGMEEQGGGSLGLQWNYSLEPKKKRLKEQDFMENNRNNGSNNNNSQMSSVDFLQTRSVSTGLGLSLDNNNSNARLSSSSGDLAFLGFVSDDIELEMQRQDAEIDRWIKIQGDRLRQAVLKKIQANQLQTLSYIEENVLQKLREKEAEVEEITKKNMELELQMEHLALEANAWQQRALYNDNMINSIRYNLQQVVAQSRDSKEGCGDSEVDDTASCCSRRIDFQLIRKDGNETKELITCKVCRVNETCMLLLPCKHLCLCKECEFKLTHCPLCRTLKTKGIEVYM